MCSNILCYYWQLTEVLFRWLMSTKLAQWSQKGNGLLLSLYAWLNGYDSHSGRWEDVSGKYKMILCHRAKFFSLKQNKLHLQNLLKNLLCKNTTWLPGLLILTSKFSCARFPSTRYIDNFFIHSNVPGFPVVCILKKTTLLNLSNKSGSSWKVIPSPEMKVLVLRKLIRDTWCHRRQDWGPAGLRDAESKQCSKIYTKRNLSPQFIFLGVYLGGYLSPIFEVIPGSKVADAWCGGGKRQKTWKWRKSPLTKQWDCQLSWKAAEYLHLGC